MDNLKPIVSYWLSVAVFYAIGFFDFLSWKASCVILWSVFLIFNILIGYFNDLKRIRIGITVIEIQFIICGAINIIINKQEPFAPTIAEKIVFYGNLLLSVFDKPNIFIAIITMFMPLSVILGVGLKRFVTGNNRVA